MPDVNISFNIDVKIFLPKFTSALQTSNSGEVWWVEGVLGVRAGTGFVLLGKQEILPLSMTFFDLSVLYLPDGHHLCFNITLLKENPEFPEKKLLQQRCVIAIQKIQTLKKEHFQYQNFLS